MKERPIIFSSEMVRAIMDGRKTQTRRVLKPGGFPWPKGVKVKGVSEIQPGYFQLRTYAGDAWEPDLDAPDGEETATVMGTPSPYQPGDHLWVRETWQHESRDPCDDAPNCGLLSHMWYRADHPDGGGPDKWRPSIFMPRWASRITLRVTGVRVERVQDISEEDARAEGVEMHGGWDVTETDYAVNCRGPFSHLWDTINAKRGYSWESNPWVWVVEFESVPI